MPLCTNGKATRFAAGLFAVFLMVSCSREHLLPDPNSSNKIMFVVSLLAPNGASGNDPSTRAIPELGPADNKVDEITILLFDAVSPYNYVDYFSIPASSISDAGDITKKQFSVVFSPGHYKALFIANSADYIADLYNLAAGTIAGGSTLLTTLTLTNMEADLSFTHSGRWNADPADLGNYRPFPMSSQAVDINVPNSVDYTANPINLMRALAKVNLTVKSTIGSNFAINDILLCNYQTGGYLVPSPDWNSSATEFTSLAAKPYGSVIDGYVNGYTYYDKIISNQCEHEIFTFEQKAPADESDFDGVGGWKSNALCLLIKATGQTSDGVSFTNRWFRLDFINVDTDNALKHVNILRNFSYKMEIAGVGNTGYPTAEEAYNHISDGLMIEIIAANDLEELKDITYNGQYQLAVDRSLVVIKSSGVASSLRVYTDYIGGWQVLSISNGGSWFTTSHISPLSNPVPNGSTASVVNLTATANATGVLRVAAITLGAGNLRKTVTVVQLPVTDDINENMPANVNTYVGAFWKANQTGERLIRIERPTTGTVTAIDGAWTALVVEGDSWIVLDDQPSKDNNVWSVAGPAKSGNDIGFDVDYMVTGTASMVGGTMPAIAGSAIYFRIGLNSAYLSTATGPARYGVVVLVANNGAIVQRIWIRQGEEADYLLRPEEAIDSDGYTNTARPYAVRISPYNLKDPVGGAPTSVITAGVPNVGLLLFGGAFVNYPTQAGHYFRWNYSRQAFAPHTPTGSISDWSDNQYGSNYWTTEESETCPSGYRRPKEAGNYGLSHNTVGGIDGSEIRQSLWIHPKQGTASVGVDNSISGYYADGFFDRRSIVNAPGGSSGLKAAVSTGNGDVAYMGRLFYGTGNASIFFPAAGYRRDSDGALTSAGQNGYYWSSSSYNGTTAWRLQVDVATTGADNATSIRSSGITIRCIKDLFSGDLEPPTTDTWGNY